MTTLSIRLPDDMAERLKDIAKVRGISLNKLMFELSAQALANRERSSVFWLRNCAAIPSGRRSCWMSWGFRNQDDLITGCAE